MIPTVLAHIVGSANCITYPLDDEVVAHLPTTLDIHDAILVATALVFRDVLGESTTLITRDAAIQASGLIPVLW